MKLITKGYSGLKEVGWLHPYIKFHVGDGYHSYGRIAFGRGHPRESIHGIGWDFGHWEKGGSLHTQGWSFYFKSRWMRFMLGRKRYILIFRKLDHFERPS